jgi:peptidoglycan/LPS O-acetylase OafA/YrhL
MALVNLSMLEDFVGIPEIMGQYWTLSLELLFYFSCVILFAMHRLNSFKAMLLVMLFFILFRELIGHLPLFNKGAFGKVTSFRYLDFMFFGLLYRKWLLNGDKMAGWQSIAVMAVAFLTFGAVADARTFMSGIYFDASGNFALKTQLTQLSAIAFFVFFTRFYRPSNVAGTFIGKISYSVYLFHPVIFYPLYSHWFQSSDLRVHPHIFIVAATTLTIVAAYLTYQLIERPCVDIGRRLSARLFVENSGLNEPTERFGRVTRSAPRKTA